jgi:5-methyltetrahydropteroyltriglutamate--homocysteine methyltransferase
VLKNYVIGFPRIGENRELKFAVEKFLKNEIDATKLEITAQVLRLKHWREQQNIDYISCNDFSLYDNMLDTAIAIGAIPKRFAGIDDLLQLQFTMARGSDTQKAMEMTKWFNTNYHYIVPELSAADSYVPDIRKIKKEYREAKNAGITPKINLIGPFTFAALSKNINGGSAFEFFEKIVSAYDAMIGEIASLDLHVTLQIEEPIFVTDRVKEFLHRIAPVYNRLCKQNVQTFVITYFDRADESALELAKTKIAGIGLDFVASKENFKALKELAKSGKKLIAGVVDGKNIWKIDYEKSLRLLNEIANDIPKDNIVVATSCSLLHLPYSIENETLLDNQIRSWLSFAKEKLAELELLTKLFFNEPLSSAWQNEVAANKALHADKQKSVKIEDSPLRQRIDALTKFEREGDFQSRIKLQKEQLNLPLLPTTTIGSFPQTKELREYRAGYKSGAITKERYESYIKKYIDAVILLQEEAGLDVLVHGEPERNDMVEYFGQNLQGFAFTQNGWVQSYGTRCVKPPILYGDVKRVKSLSGPWIAYAQSKTKKFVKGMLTGPVTILNWSFVRNDKPKEVVATQIALAISDEIAQLQNEGICIIQVDEAAFKEGYPLRKEDIGAYEKWAVDSFKLSVSSAKMQTQIHTHMCYSNFDTIIKTIEAMDADVISIETARSGNRLLQVFKNTGYEQEIGLGVYDIHSPRVPSVEELQMQIKSLLEVLPKSQLWINPDCGLKTRGFTEVIASLKNMVEATKTFR